MADDAGFPLRDSAVSKEYSLSLNAPVLVRSPSGLSGAHLDNIDPVEGQHPQPQPPPQPQSGLDGGPPESNSMDFEGLDVDGLFDFLLDEQSPR